MFTLTGSIVVLLVALVLPSDANNLGAAQFLRLPLEALVLCVLLPALPDRARRIVSGVAGALIGLVTVLKIVDLGFSASLYRQFDLVADWPLVDDGFSLVEHSVGAAGAWAATIVVLVVVAGVPVLLAASVVRVTEELNRRGRRPRRALLAATAVWVVLVLSGAQLLPGVALASYDESRGVRDRIVAVRRGLADHRTFAAAIEADRFAAVPGNRRLTGLRGKDVVFSFVESYGRSALEEPAQAAIVGPALAENEQQLAAAGFAVRSGFLTSSTYGGYSWLAHASLHSGLWIDDQSKYRTLVSSERLTLPRALRETGRRTVAVEPGNTYAWPEGDFYGYDEVWDSRTMEYRGPAFGWSSMPDQYTLAHFQREVYGKPHGPVAAEITLTSSHGPWTAALPAMVNDAQVGDGAIFGTPAGTTAADGVRDTYARSIAYSVTSLTSWAARHGDANLVLVLLGDHQAAPVVSGDRASRDVPITIVARDPAVLDKVSQAWGWEAGLHPSPRAPVMRMDRFRDEFFTLFGDEQ